MKDKGIIAVLSFFVLGLLGYIGYQKVNEGMTEAEMKSEMQSIKSDYELLQRDLEKNMNNLHLSNEIINAQKEKIEAIFSKSKITEAELEEAKKLMKSISNGVMEEYQRRVKNLQIDKDSLSKINENTEGKLLGLNKKILELETAKTAIETAKTMVDKKYTAEKKESERKTILLKQASALSLSNFTLKSIKVRNNGKEVETSRASRIDKIKVSFDINENFIAEEGAKDLYIVVYKPDETIATFENAAGGLITSNGRDIKYSDKIVINYVKQSENTIEFEWKGTEFQRGKYQIDVYQKMPKDVVKIGGAAKNLE
ncbi:MAG: hypothetical protein Q4C75_01845 [Bergeyella zoohelcum]|nr:hypothetical protein [Bergeyella zoohelcum]